MPRLLRVHFSSIGHRDARLSPLTLDFRDRDGNATDSVLWLRNAGGKSSLINLLFSVFRPRRSDFLGAAAEGKARRLEDYVKPKDLAFVVTEWSLASNPDARCFVGCMLAWKGQIQTSDASKLRKLYFSLCADGPDLSFEQLPIHGLGEPAPTFDAFHEYLRALANARPAAQVVYTEHHRVWNEHLERLGLDPELFKYQIRMNLREGAADEAFRFPTALDFIHFLLTLAFDTRHADQLAKNLEQLRDQFARRPEYELERSFIHEAMAALVPMIAAVRDCTRSRSELESCVADLASLLAGLGDRAASLAEQATRSLEAAKAMAEAGRLAGNERDKRGRWARGLEHLALELDVQEKQARHGELSDRLDEATSSVCLVEAAIERKQVDRLTAELDHLRDELRRAEARLAPERRRLEQAGSELHAALDSEQRRVSEALADLDGRVDVARATCSRSNEAIEALVHERATLAQTASHLRDRLSRRERARDKLQTGGWIEPRESVTVAIARWAGTRDEAERARSGARAQRGVSELALERTGERERSLSHELASQQAVRKQASERFDDGMQRRQRLQDEACIAEVEAVDEPDLGSPGLEERLRGEATATATAVLRLRVDGAEDERALSGIEARGLLPASRDVEVVADRLRARGINAHAGAAYLAETVPDGVRLDLLTSDPARFGGVIVASELLPAHVEAAVDGIEVRCPVQVSAVGKADLLPALGPVRALVIPPVAASYDHGAAAQLRGQLEIRADGRVRELARLEQRRRVFEQVAGDLRRYLDEFGRGRLESIGQGRDAAAEQIGLCEAELANLARARDELKSTLARLDGDLKQAADAVSRAELGTVSLTQFRDDHEVYVEVTRTELEQADRRLREIEREQKDAREQLAQATRHLEALRDQRSDQERFRQVLATESVSIAYRDRDPSSIPDLSQARDRYRHLLEQWERQVSENKLAWQIDEAQRAFAEASRRSSEAVEGLDPLGVAELSREPDLALRQATNEAARDRFREAVAIEKAALRHAVQQLEESTGRRDARDLPADAVAPTTAARARAAAGEMRIEMQRHADLAREAEEQSGLHRIEALRFERDSDRHGSAAERLRALAEGAGAALPEVTAGPVPDSIEEVERLLAGRRELFSQVRRQFERAEAAVQDRGAAVRAVAGAPRFSDHRSQARERMSAETRELAEECERIATQLEPRRQVVEQQLEELEKHRRILVEALSTIGAEAGRLLKRATQASTLPPTLDAWAGRPYLRILFQFPDSDDEKRARLEPLVDRLVQQAQIPGGLELVKLAVAELAGGKGFDVKILKPDAILRPEPVPITSMNTFSRGQQLTAAILLYCTLVQLRARQRGKGPGAVDAGILVLDNPIGTCSSVPLLELQRTIARLMRVQLIYATGVDDLEALDTLPNKIRLRNTMRDRTSGDFHVTEEGRVESARVVAALHA